MSAKMKLTKADIGFYIITYIFLTFCLLIVLFPLIFIVSASISDPNAVASGQVILLPKGSTSEGYQRVFRNNDIFIGYRNTIFYTVAGTVINLIVTFGAAYPLSRADFIGKKFFTLMFTFTMFFGGGLIPTYLLIKSLHLLDTVALMLIMGAASMWNIVLVRTFITSSIPQELQEAAEIDGASDLKIFFRVVLPLCGPIIAVMALFYGVGHWNEYFNAMIYMSDRNLFPLQLFLREILIQNQIAASSFTNAATGNLESMAEQARIAEIIKYSVMIVATIPVLIAYPFVQKFFIKGMMVGAIKG